MPTSLTADKSPYTAKRYTMQLSPKVHSESSIKLYQN